MKKLLMLTGLILLIIFSFASENIDNHAYKSENNCSSGTFDRAFFNETHYNSVSSIQVTHDLNILLVLSCLRDTNSTITLYDSERNTIPISIYSGSTEQTNNLISCTPVLQEYTIVPLAELDTGLYNVDVNIEEPCDICLKSNNFAVDNSKTLAYPIPDNNFLIILISLISLICFIKIKEKNDY